MRQVIALSNGRAEKGGYIYLLIALHLMLFPNVWS